MNKVLFVPAFFAPIGRNKTIKVPTGRMKKGLFGNMKPETEKQVQWVKTGYSDREIDDERLANNLAEVVEGLNKEGYEVVSVTPVTSGAYNFKAEIKSGGHQSNGYGGYGYGYGYSYTSSLIVIAKKIEETK